MYIHTQLQLSIFAKHFLFLFVLVFFHSLHIIENIFISSRCKKNQRHNKIFRLQIFHSSFTDENEEKKKAQDEEKIFFLNGKGTENWLKFLSHHTNESKMIFGFQVKEKVKIKDENWRKRKNKKKKLTAGQQCTSSIPFSLKSKRFIYSLLNYSVFPSTTQHDCSHSLSSVIVFHCCCSLGGFLSFTWHKKGFSSFYSHFANQKTKKNEEKTHNQWLHHRH